jgi:sugar-specific transcriptional regulator TrmB
MEKLIQYLKQLDLSDVEAKLYIMLLQTGPISVRELAASSDIKRTTAYFYIDQLIEKGLIVKLITGSKKHIAAHPPENLQELVEKKIKKANDIKKEFPDIIRKFKYVVPELKESGDAEIKYFKGIQNAKKIYEEALKTEELRTYVKLEETNSPFPEDIELFKNALDKNKTLVIKEIFYNSPLLEENAPEILSKHDRYSYKLMPLDLKLTSGDILIYENKVAIINYEEKVSCVVLHNKDYFNTSKEFFDFFWKTL